MLSSIFFFGWYTPARDSRLCRRQSIPCLGFSYFGAGTKEGGGMAALPEMVSIKLALSIVAGDSFHHFHPLSVGGLGGSLPFRYY